MRQRGAASLELALGAVALLVPASLLVLSFGPWLEARSFAQLAAREVGRAYVTSDQTNGGRQLVAMAATYRSGPVRLGLCHGQPLSVDESAPNGGDNCPLLEEVGDIGEPDGGVMVVVEVDVPIFSLPWHHEDGSAVTVGGVTVTGRHTEYVDLYRSFP